MLVQVTGRVTQIENARTFGKNNNKERKFRIAEITDKPTKRENLLEFVCSYSPNYDKYDDTKKLDAVHVGDTVRFNFRIVGRLWTKNDGTDMLFTNMVVCSKIEVLESGSTAASPSAAPVPAPAPAPSFADDPMDEEMPF